MDVADRLARIEERLTRLEALIPHRPSAPRTAVVAPTERVVGASSAEAPLAPQAPEVTRPTAVPLLPPSRAAAQPSLDAPPAPEPAPAPTPAAPVPPAPPPTPSRDDRAPVPAPTREAVRGRRGRARAATATPAEAAAASTAPRDLERFVGVSVLGRVGVAALLLAAAYFGQWTWARVPALARVLSLYGLAATLVVVGAVVRARVSRVYLALLWGGGVAAAYLAGAVAKLRFDLVGPTTAVALLAGACALGQTLARLARLETLALVAIAGAAAAPVLVGGAQDARTPLLVYLLAVHGWSAVVEARWGWHRARLAGLVSTLVVAATWLVAHGRHDVSTHLHVQGYLLGFTAPEWAGRAFARRLTDARASLVAIAVGFVEGASVWTSLPGANGVLRWLPAVAGAAWLSVAMLRRLRVRAPDALVRGLARVGGVLLALGAATSVGPDLTLAFGPDRTTVLFVAAVGALVLALRGYLGVGEGATSLAVALGTIAVVAVRAPGFDAATVPALLLAAALALRGDRVPWRVVGLLGAALWPFAAWGHGDGAGPGALLASHATSALLVLGALHPRVRGDGPAFARAALVVLVALGAAWGARAVLGGFDAAPPSALDAGTLSALAGVAALVLARRHGARSFAAGWRADALDVAAAAWGLGALWRVVHAAASALPAQDVGVAIESATLAAAGTLAAVLAARRGPRAVTWCGVGTVALAAAHALGTVASPGGAWPAAAQVLAVALPAVMLAARPGPTARPSRRAGAALLAAAAMVWVAAVAQPRFDAVGSVAWARLLAGAVVVAGFSLARRAGARGGDALAPVCALAAVVTGYVVGLVEVLDVVAPVASDPWRRGLVSVYSTLAAGVTLALGFRLRDAFLRWVALAGFGLVVGKVAIFDLAAVETPVRVAVTGALGAVLLIAAFAYARRGGDDPGASTGDVGRGA
ncbi:MAG: DUF2339 domain-containing protein [Planctomycetes bacterium]|nr:DUF2339 domain-containing protein [Planctomycetota bacterium]